MPSRLFAILEIKRISIARLKRTDILFVHVKLNQKNLDCEIETLAISLTDVDSFLEIKRISIARLKLFAMSTQRLVYSVEIKRISIARLKLAGVQCVGERVFLLKSKESRLRD